METNKLKAKDLINVGIYTAIYIVIFFVVGMLNAIPVLYPLLYVLIPLISGIPFMLFLTKIEKFGMVTIMSVICGVCAFPKGAHLSIFADCQKSILLLHRWCGCSNRIFGERAISPR